MNTSIDPAIMPGTANMFDGVVTHDEPHHVVVACPELEHELIVAHGGRTPVGAPVTVMVRPEKVAVQRDKPAEGMNWAQGRVADIAYLGDVSIYHVKLASGRRVQVSVTNLRHTGEQPLTWEDEVYLVWHPANALVLTQ